MIISRKGWTGKSAGECPEPPEFSHVEAEAAEGPGMLIPLKQGQVVSEHPVKG